VGLRFLVVEGNTREDRERHAATYGLMPSQSYAAVLGGIEPGAVCDLAFPADEGANLPDPAGLASYDGVVLTGSALHVHRIEPAVTRQIELMRAVYASRVPAFGSCWGLQVGTVAAGGAVGTNPLGREVGFARHLAPTEAGRLHPLLAGRPSAYDAPAVHLDAVSGLAPGSTVLAANRLAGVQAAEIRHGGGVFWGVQYHPEFDLAELASILERLSGVLVAEGFCRTTEDAAAYSRDLRALHADPGRRDLAWRHGLDGQVLDPTLRTTEIRNFVEHRVRPGAGERGRT
jgi:GMP synthase (glutamine-hydrolysing)